MVLFIISMLSEIQIALISGLFSMIGWGLSDFFVKKTVGKIGNLRTLLWSQMFALIPMFIYLISNFEIPKFSFNIFLYLLFFGIFDAIIFLLFYRGLDKGKVSVISPIFSCYAAVSVLVSIIIFHEAVTYTILLGLGIIFIGLILASFDYNDLKKIDFELKNISKGVPETLIALVLCGLYLPFWDKFLENPGWAAFVMIDKIILILTLIVIFSIKRSKIKFESKGIWKWLFIVGVFDSIAVLSLSLGFKLTRYTSIILVMSAASPVLVVLLARIFLKEKLSLTQKLGIIFVLTGMIIISF